MQPPSLFYHGKAQPFLSSLFSFVGTSEGPVPEKACATGATAPRLRVSRPALPLTGKPGPPVDFADDRRGPLYRLRRGLFLQTIAAMRFPTSTALRAQIGAALVRDDTPAVAVVAKHDAILRDGWATIIVSDLAG